MSTLERLGDTAAAHKVFARVAESAQDGVVAIAPIGRPTAGGSHPRRSSGSGQHQASAIRPLPSHEVPAASAEPLPLCDYLAAVEQFMCRYVAFPSIHEPVAIALWIAHAHLVEEFETSPMLAVTSAEMRSGKTRTLDCLELLVPRPFRVVTPSEAVVYTILGQRPRRTMLLDEADAIFSPRMADRYEGLRAILNAGNRQGTPVLRVKLDGRRREIDEFDVFGPKAIAGIGHLPDTVADRSIPIRLKRRTNGEPIAKFRRRTAAAEATTIVCDWDRVELGTVGTLGTVPDELNDRAADSWEPLLQIAGAAGADWLERGQRAAIALSCDEGNTTTVGSRLLGDIRSVFEGDDYLPTLELLDRLFEIDDAPWADWYGRPLTARALAKLLEPYRVTPRNTRVSGEPRQRGYFRSDFIDVWTRYVGEPVPSVPTVPHGLGADPKAHFSLVDLPIEEDYPASAWAVEEAV